MHSFIELPSNDVQFAVMHGHDSASYLPSSASSSFMADLPMTGRAAPMYFNLEEKEKGVEPSTAIQCPTYAFMECTTSVLKKLDDQQAAIYDKVPHRIWFLTLVPALTYLNIVTSLEDHPVQGYQDQDKENYLQALVI